MEKNTMRKPGWCYGAAGRHNHASPWYRIQTTINGATVIDALTSHGFISNRNKAIS